MNTEKIPAGKFAVNYGLILGALMVLIAIVMYATDMAFQGKQWPVYLYYVAFPIVIMYAISKYKQHSAGLLSLGDALKVGLAIGLISALVYTVYILVFNYVIDTEFNAKIIEYATDQIAQADAPVEAKEMQLKMIEFFSDPLMGSVFWIAMSLIFGLIYSLIGGLVMKQSND
jgi:hypothetical protein